MSNAIDTFLFALIHYSPCYYPLKNYRMLISYIFIIDDYLIPYKTYENPTIYMDCKKFHNAIKIVREDTSKLLDYKEEGFIFNLITYCFYQKIYEFIFERSFMKERIEKEKMTKERQWEFIYNRVRDIFLKKSKKNLSYSVSEKQDINLEEIINFLIKDIKIEEKIEIK